jgi:hypothetical protein
MAAGGTAISLLADDIQTLLTVFFVVGSAAIVPGVLRWLWWRFNGHAELVAIVAGWLTTLLLLVFKAFDTPMAALLQLPEGVEFSSDENLLGARMLLVVVLVGAVSVGASYLSPAEDMEHLKRFLLRARPFAFGWRPVIQCLGKPYKCDETPRRTLLSWAIATFAVVALLFGTGQLLLGPRWLGAGLFVAGLAGVWITIARIREDCADDHEDKDFLREIEALDAEQARGTKKDSTS